MAETLFKAPRAKKSPRQDDYEPPPPSLTSKRPRTTEDFLLFCKFILDYENYDMLRQAEELRSKANSPIGSTGSESAKSETPSSNSGEERKASDSESGDEEEDGYDTVTCYCGKPFAGRPMIECSCCLTWIHLSCARIRRTNIPDEFICVKCREKGVSTAQLNGINNQQS